MRCLQGTVHRLVAEVEKEGFIVPKRFLVEQANRMLRVKLSRVGIICTQIHVFIVAKIVAHAVLVVRVVVRVALPLAIERVKAAA